MPCNSDYMNPTFAEINSREVCQFIRYVHEKLEIEGTVKWIIEASEDTYGNPSKLNEAVQILCHLLKEVATEEKRDAIIYNAKDKTARKLADWWEEHLKADEERLKKETEKFTKEYLQKTALSKLSKEEVEALKGFLL